MYLISVYFDARTERILNKYIEQVAVKTGNDFMTKHQVPPHMTISQIEARSPEVLIPGMEKLRGIISAGEIQIVSVGMLLPYVMYAAPVLNDYLQNMTERVYETFAGIPETSISKYYQPMAWMPHVTLGKTLNKEQMRLAVEVMQEHFIPFSAKVEEIGLAKVNPHEDVIRYQLD